MNIRGILRKKIKGHIAKVLGEKSNEEALRLDHEHTWASLKESKGYPPRKILDRGSSPSGRGLFGKIFPPFGKF